MKTPTKKKIPREPAAIRRALLEDPNTAAIAEKLGVPLEEYLQQVIHFAMNPDVEPTLYIVPDKDLRAMGLEPPDPTKMGRFLTESVAVLKAADSTGFTRAAAAAAKVSLGESGSTPQASRITDENVKVELAKEIQRQSGKKA
jgi:hypothetical protein